MDFIDWIILSRKYAKLKGAPVKQKVGFLPYLLGFSLGVIVFLLIK